MNDGWFCLKDHYSYHIKIVKSDLYKTSALLEGYIKELPDVTEFGYTWEEVYELLIDTIDTYNHWENK